MTNYEQWAYYPDTETWVQINYSETPNYLEFVETPLGFISIAASEQFVHHISFVSDNNAQSSSNKKHAFQSKTLPHEVCSRTHDQLKEYFLGKRMKFSLPLFIQGTPFQCQVWRALAAVPYGTTQSYKTLAQVSGFPRAVRAVGMAMRNNPIGIVLPCHRIIGSSGNLVGYYGGLQYKTWLLEHESKHCSVPL